MNIYINLNKQITRWLGTSAGGIIAFLIAIGYTPNLLEKIIPYIPYKDFNDFGLDDMIVFFETFGLNNGSKLNHILEVFLTNRGFSSILLSKGLYDITGKDFALLSFCLEDSKTVLLDYKNSPNLGIIQGVRMSSAVPFIFKPIEYHGKMYVDGFISDNTPSNFVKYPTNCLGIHVYPTVEYNNSRLDFFDFLRITFTGQ